MRLVDSSPLYEQIRHHLISNGKRFNWVAEKLGVSKVYFTLLLQGRKKFNADTLEKLNQILGTDFKEQ